MISSKNNPESKFDEIYPLNIHDSKITDNAKSFKKRDNWTGRFDFIL